jgi:hypothetical protein
MEQYVYEESMNIEPSLQMTHARTQTRDGIRTRRRATLEVTRA